jgi:protocatechuate 3,4-dioxygenase beta subunit
MRDDERTRRADLAADNDDSMIGRLLSRREMLALLGVASVGAAALAAGCSSDSDGSPTATSGARAQAPTAPGATPDATSAGSAAATQAAPSCVVKPALTEGPYFVDEKLNRSDIRSDPSDGSVKAGTPLAIAFNVYTVSGGCAPLAGATVDIWHCDAMGVYSDASDPSFNTKGKQFLRGYQVTDANGHAAFATIYPGWYNGRAVHIHFKIRNAEANGKTSDFTSQVFFEDTLNAEVFSQQPYAAKGQPTMVNADDGIFQQGGDQLVLQPRKTASGYEATFDIGLQM